jgi:small GTP-binding protein
VTSPLRQTGVDTALPALLDGLAELLDEASRARLAQVRVRLDQDRLRILVVGEAKRGKSTLVNALLGDRVLPTGALPVTALTTTLTHGNTAEVEAHYADGRTVRQTDLSVLVDLVTEDGNPGNIRGVNSVTVRLPNALLAAGVELVDTPGIGSIHEHNTAEAHHALGQMDAAVVVTATDPPITAAEREFLTRVRRLAVHTFLVLNKTDQVEAADLPAVVGFTRDVAARALGTAARVFAVSARDAERGRDRHDDALVEQSGLPRFAAALRAYLATRRGADLRASVAAHAHRLTAAAIDDITLTLRAAVLDTAERNRRRDAFSRALTAVTAMSGESATILGGGIRDLIAETNEQARDHVQVTTRTVLTRAETWVAEHPQMRGGSLEAAAYRAATTVADRAVSEWIARRQRELDTALRGLTGRLESRLAEQLDAVRTAAEESFAVPLAARPEPAGLTATTRFRLAPPGTASVTDALATPVRTHLPGSLGRRVIARHLRTVLTDLVDQHFGRARADFQSRTEETHRQLSATLSRQLADAAEHVTGAIRRGTEVAALRAGEQQAATEELQARLAALRHLATAFEGEPAPRA